MWQGAAISAPALAARPFLFNFEHTGVFSPMVKAEMGHEA
jgi:hypothetical protein